MNLSQRIGGLFPCLQLFVCEKVGISLVYWSVVHVAVIINGDFTFLVRQPNATVQSIPPLLVFVWFALLFVSWPFHISNAVMFLFLFFYCTVVVLSHTSGPWQDVFPFFFSPFFFLFHPHLTIHFDSQSHTVLVLFLGVWFSFLHFRPVPIPRVYIYVCSSLNLSLSHELIVCACVSLHVSRVELTFSYVCFLPQPLCSHQSFCIVDNVAWCGVCNVEWKLLFDLEGVKPLWLWKG